MAGLSLLVVVFAVYLSIHGWSISHTSIHRGVAASLPHQVAQLSIQQSSEVLEMKVMLKETVVRWHTVDVPDLDLEEHPSEYEPAARNLMWEDIAANAGQWDGEEVLEADWVKVED